MTVTAVGITIEKEKETGTGTEKGKGKGRGKENAKRAERGTGIESLHEVRPQNQHHRDHDMIAASLRRAQG